MMKPVKIDKKVMDEERIRRYYEEHKYRNLIDIRYARQRKALFFLRLLLPLDVRGKKSYGRPPVPYCLRYYQQLIKGYNRRLFIRG